MAAAALVLIVDDVPDNREAYAEYLRFRGFRTLEAGTGREAIATSREHHPDVLLLDMRLPDIDGREVSRVVRADPSLQHTKIVAVSASVFPADVAAALEAGCHVFLQKPCLPDALVTEIERLLAQPVP